VANTFIEGFDFPSEECKEGYGNLLQFMRAHGRGLEDQELMTADLNLMAAYFIQKDIESTTWWRDVASSQTGSLENQILLLVEQLKKTEEKVDLLRDTIKYQGISIDLILSQLKK
jgi:hypothetical protein